MSRSNYAQALAVQQNIDCQLDKKNIREAYNEEINKAMAAGAIVALTKEEISNWTGGVHYVTVFPVCNPGSQSTKVRVVSNSKLTNSHTKKSLNDLIKPIPNALSDILDIILQWREHEIP